MDIRTSRLAREATAALAVLTLYVLTLLVPLHQAQATQDRFEALGFDNLSGWSLCIADEADPEQTERLPNGCPFAGVAKISLALAHVNGVDFGAIGSVAAIAYGAGYATPIYRFKADEHPVRAPPASS